MNSKLIRFMLVLAFAAPLALSACQSHEHPGENADSEHPGEEGASSGAEEHPGEGGESSEEHPGN